MSEIKRMPEAAASTSSLQAMERACQEVLRQACASQGKTCNITPDQFKFNTWMSKTEDGSVKLSYADSQNDFICEGQMNPATHEMSVVAGQKSNPDNRSGAALIEMEDACSLQKILQGNQAPQDCKDGWVDPRMQGSAKFASIEHFKNYCSTKIAQFGDENYNGQHRDFKPGRTHIEEVPGFASYELKFESSGDKFFCQGIVNYANHQMALSSGRIGTEGTSEEAPFEMTDACSLGRHLLGEKNIPQGCHDFTSERRLREKRIRQTGQALMVAWLTYDLWKFGRNVRALGLRGAIAQTSTYRALAWTAKKFYWPFRQIGRGLRAAIPALSRLALRGVSVSVAATRATTAALPRAAALGSRIPFLGGNSGSAKLTRGGIVAYLFAEAFTWIATDGDYDRWVNKRVGDEVFYAEGVYSYGRKRTFEDFCGWMMGYSRHMVREMLPDGYIDTGIVWSNPKVKEEILANDRVVSAQATASISATFPALFLDTDIYPDPKTLEELRSAHQFFPEHVRKAINLQDPNHPDFKTTLDLGILGCKIVLTDEEHALMQEMQNGSDSHQACFTPQGARDRALKMQRIMAYVIQQAATYLVFVKQPMNDWAREVFNEDGTLKEGMEAQFLAKLTSLQEDSSTPIQTQILAARVDLINGGSK